ncbi:uncharacterized protein LOC121969302 [Zingiber officinale]|uniref:uncharacterized protein LOC121969302 n=1 Tax=Zingiber officinale TaxID=94328 RepID=UPI001C4DCB11|nr:uncharacterized protein LOC121969302 [Zingiber officinale]
MSHQYVRLLIFPTGSETYKYEKLSSVETLWRKSLYASLFEGCWIYKIFNSKVARRMNIEDFLNRFENFAKSVRQSLLPFCSRFGSSLPSLVLPPAIINKTARLRLPLPLIFATMVLEEQQHKSSKDQ